MSQKKRKRSRRSRGQAAPRRHVAEVRTRLWPVAVHWYLDQARLAIYTGVRLRQEPEGAAFVLLPGVGEVRIDEPRPPQEMVDSDGDLVAALLPDRGGALNALLGMGSTRAEAIDGVLGALEQAFVDEVGVETAPAILASVLADCPELADEQVARHLLRAAIVGPLAS